MSPRTGSFEVRGLELAYHEWGAREAPPLLCLHGFLDHGQSFAPVAALLPELRVIAVDFRGHGCSGWIGAGGYYHFHDYFYDLAALLEHLALDRVSVLAHSMGGSVATGLAAIRPGRIESLVLLEGMGPPAGEASEYPERLARWVQSLAHLDASPEERAARRRPLPSVEVAAERLAALNARLPPARALAFARSFTEPAPGGGVVWRYDPLHRTPSARPFYVAEAEPMWRAITAPVLSLIGADSAFQIGDADLRHAAVRDLRVAVVEEAGHNIHHDVPEVVAGVVRWWRSGDREGPLPAGLRAP